jgi:hypothetical protein
MLGCTLRMTADTPSQTHEQPTASLPPKVAEAGRMSRQRGRHAPVRQNFSWYTCFVCFVLLVLMSVLTGGRAQSENTPRKENAAARPGQFIGMPAVPLGIGVNIHFIDNREDEVNRIARMGFRLIRTDLTWSKVETIRSVYNWGAYDRMMAQLHKYNLVPILVLDYGNPLYYSDKQAKALGRPDSASHAPLDQNAQSAFIPFARAAAARYKDQVIWEVWNEPNLTFGKPLREDLYADFAVAVCRGLREVDPNARVVGPAAGGFSFYLLEKFIQADSTGCFSAISVHPYRDEAPESVLGDWQKLRELIARIGNNPHAPVIDSEFGYSVTGTVWNEERQADYVTRAYLLDLLAGVPITVIYDLRNDSPNPHDKESNFGLFGDSEDPRYAGRMKQAGVALSTLLHGLNGLTLIGRVRSAETEFILAFGSGSQPTKIAAWSIRPDPVSVDLGPDACISAKADRPCGEDGLVTKTAPMTVRLTGRPVVVPVEAWRGEQN